MNSPITKHLETTNSEPPQKKVNRNNSFRGRGGKKKTNNKKTPRCAAHVLTAERWMLQRSESFSFSFWESKPRAGWAHVFTSCSTERAEGSRRPRCVCHSSAWLAETCSFKTLWLHCWGMNFALGLRKSKVKFCHQIRAHVSWLGAGIKREGESKKCWLYLKLLNYNKIKLEKYTI